MGLISSLSSDILDEFDKDLVKSLINLEDIFEEFYITRVEIDSIAHNDCVLDFMHENTIVFSVFNETAKRESELVEAIVTYDSYLGPLFKAIIKEELENVKK